MKIGVLALQGDFAEHLAVLRRLGAQAAEVRLPAGLDGLDGLGWLAKEFGSTRDRGVWESGCLCPDFLIG